MIIGIIARFACNICCFLYPAYASYKALSTPLSDAQGDVQVERWLMYWAVVGTWTATESVAGWLFTWLPFYSLIKTAIFLALSLPQSEASSYIYRSFLAPFFYQHESDIDAFLYSLRTRATEMLSNGAGYVWDQVRQQLNVALPAASQFHQSSDQVAAPPTAPPSFHDPASGAVQQMYGFMTHYAARYVPSAMAVLQAATAGTLPPGVAQRQAQIVQETMSMPIPQPTPPPNEARRTSRTFQQAAQEHLGADSSARRLYRTDQRLHPRSVSNPSGPPQVSQRNSDESINTRSSRSSMGGNGGWSGEMSAFEDIRRDEVPEETGYAVPPGRPKSEARRSSWFGWGGQAQGGGEDKRGKAE